MPKMQFGRVAAGLSCVALALGSLPAHAGTLVINADTSDPAPKQMIEELVASFEKAHPDVEVELNIFDHEGYKTSIRNFLTADAPDIVAWYAGNRMAPFVNANLFEDVSDLWVGLDNLKSARASMTIDGKQWGMPYTYYQWGVYYRKDIFKQHGIGVPKTWDEFLAASKKLNENGVKPITIGTKYLWTTGGWFDYLNLRQNGYEFHMDLTSGKIKWTDPRVANVFDRWDELVKPGYFIDNHASYSWQEALKFMIDGEAAMYLMGNFAVAPLREAGLSDDQLGFFQFPVIDPSLPLAEDAPTDTFHIPAESKNKEDARKFLAFLATPAAQTQVNKTLGQLPVNSKASVENDQFLKAGFKMLSDSYALAQFFDRDAPAEMAQEGMKEFQRYMVKPEERDKILERLDKVQARAYK